LSLEIADQSFDVRSSGFEQNGGLTSMKMARDSTRES